MPRHVLAVRVTLVALKVELESLARGGVLMMTPNSNLDGVFLLDGVCVLVWVVRMISTRRRLIFRRVVIFC